MPIGATSWAYGTTLAMPTFLSDQLIGLLLHIRYHVFARQQAKNECLYLNYPDDSVSTSAHTRRGRLIPRDNLPLQDANKIRLVLVSDTHDKHNLLGALPKCDVFIHSGDVLMTSRQFTVSNIMKKLDRFNRWLGTIDAKTLVVVAGNHDKGLERLDSDDVMSVLRNTTHYACNSCFIIGDDLSVFGSPASDGNSLNRAFQSDEFIGRTRRDAPDRCTVLLLHGPCSIDAKPKIRIFGHHHSSYGIYLTGDSIRDSVVSEGLTICSSSMDDSYRMSHAPIVVDIPRKECDIPYTLPVQENDILITHSSSRGSVGKRSSKVYIAND